MSGHWFGWVGLDKASPLPVTTAIPAPVPLIAQQEAARELQEQLLKAVLELAAKQGQEPTREA